MVLAREAIGREGSALSMLREELLAGVPERDDEDSSGWTWLALRKRNDCVIWLTTLRSTMLTGLGVAYFCALGLGCLAASRAARSLVATRSATREAHLLVAAGLVLGVEVEVLRGSLELACAVALTGCDEVGVASLVADGLLLAADALVWAKRREGTGGVVVVAAERGEGLTFSVLILLPAVEEACERRLGCGVV